MIFNQPRYFHPRYQRLKATSCDTWLSFKSTNISNQGWSTGNQKMNRSQVDYRDMNQGQHDRFNIWASTGANMGNKILRIFLSLRPEKDCHPELSLSNDAKVKNINF